MLFNAIKTIVISLLLIALIHYLYIFFKDTLTVPKVKDLVNKPAKRYDEMFDSIRINNIGIGQQGTGQQGTGQQPSMQDELKNFLSELKKPNNNNNNNNNNNTNNNNTMNDSFPTANDTFSDTYSSF